MLLSNYQMVKAEALIRDGIIVIRAGTQATIVWIQIQTATLIGCMTFGKLFISFGLTFLVCKMGRTATYGYFVVRLNEIINKHSTVTVT